MRWILSLGLLAVLTPHAPAQLIRLKLRDERVEKRFRDHLIEFNGAKVLVGEIKSGLTLKDRTWHKEKSIQMWVANPADPAAVPYKLEDGQKVAAGRKTSVSLAQEEVVDIQFFMRRSSFLALSREYDQRLSQIEKLEEQRDSHKKNSRHWFYTHRMMVNAMERLHTWLQGTVYPAASKKLAKQIEKQKKVVAKDAFEERARLAQDSIREAPDTTRLTEVAAKICGDKYTFKAQESQHLRITYFTKLPDQKVADLLRLGETMIDGFRAHNIDPFLDEDYVDTIPDGLFLEFYFGPNDLNVHEHLLEDYYDIAWGDNRQARIQAASGRYRRLTAPQYLQYWNSEEHPDLDGIVAHGLGHTLTSIHYNKNRKEGAPPWLEEAVAYYMSLEYLGQNSVMCKEFVEATYASDPGQEGEKTIEIGEREQYNRIAREQGPPIDGLVVKTLHQMNDADFAKGWSLYDYVVFNEGKTGQLWLRQACELSGQSLAFVPKWREASEELFEVTGEDVFRVIDTRWKEYAEQFQPEPKKRRRRTP